MRPYFAGNPLASYVFAGTVAVWVAIEIRQALNRRSDATSGDRGSLMFVRLCSAAGAILANLALRANAAALPHNTVIFGTSLAIVWVGIGLRWWSFRTLGHYFTFTVMTSADQPVITTGPYRYLRHPSYTGILLILGGIGLTLGNWLSLAALTLFPLIGFIYRIRVEEAALSSTLGAAYTTYARGRKRLIPFVW